MSEDQTRSHIDRRVATAWLRAALQLAWQKGEPGGGFTELAALRDDPLRTLGEFMTEFRPAVLLLSRYAHAEHLLYEELVALEEQGALTPRTEADDHGVFVSRPGQEGTIVLSFHVTDPNLDVQQVAHTLSTSDAMALLGATRRDDIPEAIRDLVDLEINLRETEQQVFEQVFADLFGEPLPGHLMEEDTGWRDTVVPTDLQQPLRLGLPATEAAAYIRERVRERTRQYIPERGPGLDELAGLEAAKDIALDLIRDIQLARDGAISWSEVDRGMLLVGPPGTGKTTLARAIARACGVRFIAASAAEWQTVQNLGEHLAAIRRSFDAARNQQPAILFIDELDSIGNRERFTDAERTYNTPVVNQLLKEIDGFGPRDRLVVIGATNYPDNVDPALRRSGRLDQVVQIPCPGVDALEQILRYYLEPRRAAGQLQDDIDLGTLARLCLGLTGADIEERVRGAARRARRSGGRIGQTELLAEVLGKPRRPGTNRPLPQATLKQLSVYQAGHVVARLTGPGRGQEIAYVSILPRSDGRLGYLATTEAGLSVTTRKDYEDRIKQYLAGRAAEEAVFGPDGVSDIASEPGDASDLVRAIELAYSMLGLTGLGEGRDLLWWSAVPAEARGALDDRVNALLTRLQAEAVEFVSAHRDLLGRVTDLLLQRQELRGAELVALLAN